MKASLVIILQTYLEESTVHFCSSNNWKMNFEWQSRISRASFQLELRYKHPIKSVQWRLKRKVNALDKYTWESLRQRIAVDTTFSILIYSSRFISMRVTRSRLERIISFFGYFTFLAHESQYFSTKITPSPTLNKASWVALTPQVTQNLGFELG